MSLDEVSWLPVYNAWVVCVAILSFFLWKLGGVLFFLVVSIFSIFFLVKEVITVKKHYVSGFWLFLLTEAIAFGTLLFLCTVTEEKFIAPLSLFSELPLLGCFILTSSSVTVTAYHHCLGTGRSWIFLVATIILGWCFVGLQLYEFYDCECDLTYCIYHACCFCTVGLHFSHVVGGIVALTILLFLGEGSVSRCNIDYVVWYWHFVDYIWLLVFLIVYLS